MESCTSDATRLQSILGSLERVVIAFSGGVDSSVVAAAAHRAAPDTAVAVTAVSPSLASWQLQVAHRVAAEIGIEHRTIQTREGERAEYRRNDARRCFYCKQTLYQTLIELADQFPGAAIVSGTNAEDLGDYRPGIEAAAAAGVRAPLAELNLGKAQVRALAAHYQLSNHDLPASPCLASRIAYGTEVTIQRLHQVERAEAFLRQQGFVECRVRLHPGELARIEVPRSQIAALVALDASGELTQTLRGIGFQFVAIDLAGLQSGGLNRMLVPVTDLTPVTPRREAIG